MFQKEKLWCTVYLTFSSCSLSSTCLEAISCALKRLIVLVCSGSKILPSSSLTTRSKSRILNKHKSTHLGINNAQSPFFQVLHIWLRKKFWQKKKIEKQFNMLPTPEIARLGGSHYFPQHRKNWCKLNSKTAEEVISQSIWICKRHCLLRQFEQPSHSTGKLVTSVHFIPPHTLLQSRHCHVVAKPCMTQERASCFPLLKAEARFLSAGS